MTTLRIKIDLRTTEGKAFYKMIKELPFVSICSVKDEYQPNAETIKAIKDADEGKTIKYSSFEDFLAKIESKPKKNAKKNKKPLSVLERARKFKGSVTYIEGDDEFNQRMSK